MIVGKLAKNIAAMIREDLEGRNGIYDAVESDTQLEIQEEHEELIQKEIDEIVNGR